jgi:hypothetical protein
MTKSFLLSVGEEIPEKTHGKHMRIVTQFVSFRSVFSSLMYEYKQKREGERKSVKFM